MFRRLPEFHAGTDPGDATSFLRLLTVDADGAGTYNVSFTSVAGRNYQLQVSLDLVNWSDLPGATKIASGAISTIAGANLPEQSGAVYFRIVTSAP